MISQYVTSVGSIMLRFVLWFGHFWNVVVLPLCCFPSKKCYNFCTCILFRTSIRVIRIPDEDRVGFRSGSRVHLFITCPNFMVSRLVWLWIYVVKFPWLSNDVPRLPSHGKIYILQWVRFAGVVLASSISILKIFKSSQSYLDIQVYRFRKFMKISRKIFLAILWHSVHIWYSIVSRICFKINH